MIIPIICAKTNEQIIPKRVPFLTRPYFFAPIFCETKVVIAKAKHVIGIEIVEPAIINARENAQRNGYDNTEFIVGDAAVEMPKLYKAGVRPDVIVFDPIRAGCKEEVLTSAAGMEPKRIVYVSCNPATMARDIEILTHYGYELKEVQPVDMFPMTAHVEAVALLTRSNVTQ